MKTDIWGTDNDYFLMLGGPFIFEIQNFSKNHMYFNTQQGNKNDK